VGIAASNAAVIAQQQGNAREAERLAAKSVAVLETLGPRNLSLRRPLQVLAGIYIDQGQFDRAWKTLSRIEAIGPVTAVDTALLSGARGTLFEREGRIPEAEQQYKEAIVQWEKAGASLDLVPELENLALLHMKQKRNSEAEALFRRALSIVDASPQATEHLHVSALTNLGIILIQQRDWNDAQIQLAQAMSLALNADIRPDLRQRLYEAYAVVLRKAGQKREAGKLETKARGIVAPQTSPQIVSLRELKYEQSR
jgi:tetratricopeptide (TPR) repeat protein